MQQVIVIHGGTTFEKYEDYLNYLESKPAQIERLIYKPLWKERLQSQLGEQYQVLLPTMPNKTNARYSEWKLWFDAIAQIATEDCILIGHSMGGIFLAKYLSENKFPVRIAQTILIAAPFSDESTEDLTDFKLTRIGDLFREQSGATTLFFGTDDPVIASSEIEQYQREVPDAKFVITSAPDHFMREEIPELLQQITSGEHSGRDL